MLGDYEVVTKLRSGGMADLYLAKREGPGGFARHVAIKVVHPRLARDRSFIDMFLDEARLAASISHPNVVHIEDLGQQGGTYYLVMEYLHGTTLAQVLMKLYAAGRRLAPAAAVSLVADAAAGLHAAHQARGPDGQLLHVVHRDVSPQNLFLTNEGEMKVIDFGIAKASGRLHKTQGNALKGKMPYMPPEQFTGADIDHRADLYALGVVLWEMLTLERLFQAKDDFSLIQEVRAGPRCAPSALVPRISPALDAVVMGALAGDPNGRPASGRDLRQLLLEAEPEARAIERIDLAGMLFALIPDELASQAQAMGRPSLARPRIDAFETEATPLQCLDRLTVPHHQDFDDDEATIVDSSGLYGVAVPAPMLAPGLVAPPTRSVRTRHEAKPAAQPASLLSDNTPPPPWAAPAPPPANAPPPAYAPPPANAPPASDVSGGFTPPPSGVSGSFAPAPSGGVAGAYAPHPSGGGVSGAFSPPPLAPISDPKPSLLLLILAPLALLTLLALVAIYVLVLR